MGAVTTLEALFILCICVTQRFQLHRKFDIRTAFHVLDHDNIGLGINGVGNEIVSHPYFSSFMKELTVNFPPPALKVFFFFIAVMLRV
jgi:hypothetical protein